MTAETYARRRHSGARRITVTSIVALLIAFLFSGRDPGRREHLSCLDSFEGGYHATTLWSNRGADGAT